MNWKIKLGPLSLVLVGSWLEDGCTMLELTLTSWFGSTQCLVTHIGRRQLAKSQRAEETLSRSWQSSVRDGSWSSEASRSVRGGENPSAWVKREGGGGTFRGLEELLDQEKETTYAGLSRPGTLPPSFVAEAMDVTAAERLLLTSLLSRQKGTTLASLLTTYIPASNAADLLIDTEVLAGRLQRYLGKTDSDTAPNTTRSHGNEQVEVEYDPLCPPGMMYFMRKDDGE